MRKIFTSTLLLISFLFGASVIYAQDIYTETDSDTNKTGIYSVKNLLKNPGFETKSEDFGNNQYAPADWSIEGASFSATNGVRVGANQDWGAAPAYREGNAALLWRDDSNSMAGAYLYQETEALKANTEYKAAFLTMAHNQNRADAKYYVRVGTTPNGSEYFEKEFKSLANDQKADVTGTFTTPASVGSKTYFSISNQATFPENYNGKWTIIHLDRMALYEANSGNSLNDVNANNIQVYSENKSIIVTGADEYTVYSISGAQVNPDLKLNTGLYIVAIKGVTPIKVLVK